MSHWIWWAIALALFAAEMLSGAFYLLALGLACAAGAVTAVTGFSFEIQCLVTSVAALLLCLIVYKFHHSINSDSPSLTFDIGETVRVISWGPGPQARVAYRGSHWDAELADPNAEQHETMRIVATRGSTLIIAPDGQAGNRDEST